MNKYKKQFSIAAGGFCNDYKDQYIKYLEAELLVRDEQIQELEASEDASNCILGDVRKCNCPNESTDLYDEYGNLVAWGCIHCGIIERQ